MNDRETLIEIMVSRGIHQLDAIDLAELILEAGFEREETNFDEEEVHANCTVFVWKNSENGKVSVGWVEND